MRPEPGTENEVCNDGFDSDCDGSQNENGAMGESNFSRDADGDDQGNAALSLARCTAPPGYVADNRDCDDTLDFVFRGAAEVCNGIHDDRDGQMNEGGVCRASCTGGYNPTTGNNDQSCTDNASWTSTLAACTGLGRWDLVRIDTAVENGWVKRPRVARLGSSRTGIGANDRTTEQTWVWSRGNAVFWRSGSGTVAGLFAGWNRDSPNDDGTEDCAEMDAGGSWNDTECGNPRPFISESD